MRLSVLGIFTSLSLAYQQAIHLDPNFALAYIGEGNLHEHFKHYEEALKIYREATRVASNSPLGYYYQGNALKELTHYEEDSMPMIRLFTWTVTVNSSMPTAEKAIYLNMINVTRKRSRPMLMLSILLPALLMLTIKKGIYLNALALRNKGNHFISQVTEHPALNALRVLLSFGSSLSMLLPNLLMLTIEKGQVLIALEREEQRLKKVREEPKLSVSEILKLNQQNFQEIHRNQESEELFGGHQQRHKESRRKQKPKAPNSNPQRFPSQEIQRIQDLNDLVPSEELLKHSRQRGKRIPRKRTTRKSVQPFISLSNTINRDF